MSFLRRDEKKRLTAELIDDLISRPDPMEEYDKFQTYDFIIMEALLICIIVIISSVRDLVTASLSFTGVMLVIFVYIYFKSIKKQEGVLGKLFLESTTYIGDSDIVEQIEVQGWELLITPAKTLERDKLVYDRDDLMETLTALKTPGLKFGSEQLNAPIVEELARIRADKYIDEFKAREAKKQVEKKWFGLKKKKPKDDISKLEEDRKAIFELIENIDFEDLGEEIEYKDIE